MNFVDVIKQCENAGGAGTKKVIHAALGGADTHTRRLIKEALNPYRVFGIRKYDFPKVFDDNADGVEKNLASFYYLLDELHERNLTGNSAKIAVQNVLSMFTKEQAEYLSRVFDKDLKAGFSADTFNKIWKSPEDTIPTFEVMLADKCGSTEDFETYVTFPCQADFKYDGCLSKSWVIQLRDGRNVTIGEFVDKNMEGEVLSYNNSTKKKEWKKVLAKIKNSMPERSYEWFVLTLSDGTELPPLTGNHRIWLPKLKCWRRADELQVDDFLLIC